MTKLIITTFLVMAATQVVAEPDLNAAVKDYCKCREQPDQKAREVMALVQQAKASGDSSQLVAMQDELMIAMQASVQCFQRLPEKYPDIHKSDELKGKVMEMAKSECPDPASKR